MDDLPIVSEEVEEQIVLEEVENVFTETDENSNDSLDNIELFFDQPDHLSNTLAQSIWTVYDEKALAQHDIAALESRIFQFCVYYVPLRKSYSGQCFEYIRAAQDEVIRANYGNAIARFKDFLCFVDNFAVSKAKSDFSTSRIIELKTMAYERLALCYLLKDNMELALKFAHKAIIQKPVLPQSHMWRAIANRRLGNLATALRSLTMFGTLVLVSPHDCPYQIEDQQIISLYWKVVLIRLQRCKTNIKLLYFPSYNLNFHPPKEQEERMSFSFLMNYPNYNSLIHADSALLHILPVGNGLFSESILEQKQSYGFIYNQEESRYFAFLPGANYFNSNSENTQFWAGLNSKTAQHLWETSDFINSTSSQMSLKPGRGIYEHLVYCHFLLKEEKFEQVLIEYECILADLAIFPVLSDVEWTDDLALVVDANIEMIENAVEALKEHNSKQLETVREIEQIKQWLEFSERKYRVQQRLLEEEWYILTSSYNRSYYSPKRKYTALHRFLEETKSKRHLFPKERL